MAIRYIGFGDTHFGNQKYPDALDRYKKAVQADPQNADGWFRQAFALSAMGRYEQATKALKRGLEINPDWGKSDFRLSEVYGNNDDLKQSNLDAMEKDVAANPNNGDAALMLAIHYHFDGKQDQAAPLLQRALKVVGNDGVVGGFLGK
jgi:tetratricopeptide (TPR) repeat protein